MQERPLAIAGARVALAFPAPRAPRWGGVAPAGELPADWDEQDTHQQLGARLADPRAHPHARARAAVALAQKPPSAATLAALRDVARDATAPELARLAALEALGEVRTAGARDCAARAADRGAVRDAAPPAPRARARAAARLRGIAGNEALALELVAAADAESSQWCAGELLAARAALELPGATPILRARMARPSWNDRLRAACVRGLGLSAEAPAVDEVAAVLGTDAEPDAVLSSACEAAGPWARACRSRACACA